LKKKAKAGQRLTSAELKFLYEIDSKIEGFGYDKDPRVKELREQRDAEKDMLIIFECKKEQIATRSNEITKSTKAYVGKLEPGIFELMQIYNIEYIYTSFPEGEIKRQKIEIGGKDVKTLENELKKNGINISNHANDIMKSKDFTTSEKQEEIETVRLKVSDLGFENGATTNEIYKRAEELGLELCPAEVGPQLRLQYVNQPMNEWVFIGMKQIPARDGDPFVFDLERNEDGLWLNNNWADPEGGWSPGSEFIFYLCKSS
jgi:hypothetical protein